MDIEESNFEENYMDFDGENSPTIDKNEGKGVDGFQGGQINSS